MSADIIVQDVVSQTEAAIKADLDIIAVSGLAAGSATAANQATEIASLASLDTKQPSKGTAAMAGSSPVTLATDDTQMATLILALSVPTKFAAVTPSDATDLTATATKGLIVTVAGAVFVRGTGDAAIANIGTFPAGSFIPGHFMRVGASTTATVIQCGG